MKKKVTVYCGMSIEDKCGKELHPINVVLEAQKLIMSDKDEIAYSNNHDFVSAIKYIGKKNGVTTSFFLDGTLCGNDIEPIFENFNKSLDMIYALGDSDE